MIFGLANPVPGIDPLEAQRHAAIVAKGRSDFPNQINNVLAFLASSGDSSTVRSAI